MVGAGLAKLQQRCIRASVPTGVLSCSHSASFKSLVCAVASMQRALTAIVETFNVCDPSIDRYVMLVNIGGSHWVSAYVSFWTRSVSVNGYIGGSSPLKALIVSRLPLFAREANLRRQVLFPKSPGNESKWTVADEVNEPAQQDGYNCGLFAFAHICSMAHGQDLAALSVVGDHLRLSFINYVMECGVSHAAAQRGGQEPAG